MRSLARSKRASIYIIAVFIVGVIIIPIVWFGWHMIFWEVEPVMVEISEDLGTNTTEFNQVDSLFQVFDNWLHVVGLFALCIFAFFASQKRGERMW